MDGNRLGSGSKLVLALLTLAALGGAVAVIVDPGTEGTPARSATVVTSSSSSEIEEPAEPTRTVSNRYVETYEIFAPKDPFEPLVARSGGASAGGIPTASAGAVTATFEGAAADTGLHHELKVVRVDSNSALIVLDGNEFSVREGEIFGERFQLLSLADQCATMLFGDDQFTLCEGEQIFK